MLAVTALGMVSALGLDLVTSCAAARAGLRRIVEVDDLYIKDLEGEETAPVTVHRVPRITTGLFGFTRLLQLGLTGLEDLLSTGAAMPGERIGMILIVGGGSYRDAWSRRLHENGEAGSGDLDDDDVVDFRAVRDRVVRDLLPALIQRANLSVDPLLRMTLPSTAVGLIAALKQAEEWLERGACDRCIVGGVDSLVEPATLAAIDGLGLMKTPDRPVSMIPGEAACFMMLERPHSVAARPSPILAILDAPAEAREAANPLIAPGNPDGGGVCAAISQTMARLSDGGRDTAMTVVNLNGDASRTTSWWRGVLRTASRMRLEALPAWYPPLFFGDIGAATGPVSIALLARGWARRYAPASNALVCLMDDDGARGSLDVRAPTEINS